MSYKTQTAVEWLFANLPDNIRLSKAGFDVLQMALKMEEKQIIYAFYAGYNYDGGRLEEEAERYYSKTYVSKL